MEERSRETTVQYFAVSLPPFIKFLPPHTSPRLLTHLFLARRSLRSKWLWRIVLALTVPWLRLAPKQPAESRTQTVQAAIAGHRRHITNHRLPGAMAGNGVLRDGRAILVNPSSWVPWVPDGHIDSRRVVEPQRRSQPRFLHVWVPPRHETRTRFQPRISNHLRRYGISNHSKKNTLTSWPQN